MCDVFREHGSLAAFLCGVMWLLSMPAPARADGEKTGAAEAAGVPLRVTDWEGVQKLISRHKGKVVVVDIWTTTCPACLKEFPRFAAWRKTFGPENVALISVNCDYDGIKTKPPAYYRPRVLEFLSKHPTGIENVLLNTPLIDFLEEIQLASTPALLVYGPDGRLVKRFDNDDAVKIEDEFQMEDVEQLLAEQLGSTAGEE